MKTAAKILIVEDDVDLRRTVSESLEYEGFAAAQGVSATPGGAASAQVVAPLSEVLVLSARGAIRDLGDVRVGGAGRAPTGRARSTTTGAACAAASTTRSPRRPSPNSPSASGRGVRPCST